MMTGPTKLLSELNPTNIQCHRHFSCPRYGECLMVAAMKDWGSFSCKPCTLARGQLTKEPDETLLLVFPICSFENERTNHELARAVERRQENVS